MGIYFTEVLVVVGILWAADRCCEAIVKEGNAEGSSNLWSDFDNFSKLESIINSQPLTS